MSEWYYIEKDHIRIDIKAVPGASKTEFCGITDNRLKVKIAAAPEGGRANAALITFMARTLKCPKSKISLLHGEKSRLKTLAIPLEYRIQLDTLDVSIMEAI